MIDFSVNGKRIDLDVDPSTPLLWAVSYTHLRKPVAFVERFGNHDLVFAIH